MNRAMLKVFGVVALGLPGGLPIALPVALPPTTPVAPL